MSSHTAVSICVCNITWLFLSILMGIAHACFLKELEVCYFYEINSAYKLHVGSSCDEFKIFLWSGFHVISQNVNMATNRKINCALCPVAGRTLPYDYGRPKCTGRAVVLERCPLSPQDVAKQTARSTTTAVNRSIYTDQLTTATRERGRTARAPGGSNGLSDTHGWLPG